jgi:hypothetical protein
LEVELDLVAVAQKPRRRVSKSALLVAGLPVLCLATGILTFATLRDQWFTPSYAPIAIAHPVCGVWHIQMKSSAFTAVSALSKSDVWFGGTSAGTRIGLNQHTRQQLSFARWNGSRLETMAVPNWEADEISVKGMAVRSTDDAWAVGYISHRGRRELLTVHWDGSEWRLIPVPKLPTHSLESSLDGVSIVSVDDVWAVGYQTLGGVWRTLILRWNGKEWKIIPSPNIDYAMNKWGQRVPVTAQDNQLSNVISLSKSDAWAFGVAHDTLAGEKSLALHWDGASWKVSGSPKVGLITDASVDQSKGIWVVNGGSNAESWMAGAVKKQNSSGWDKAEMPRIEQPILLAVSAFSPDYVWGVGYKWSGFPQGAKSHQVGARSLVMHWDGTSWTEVPGPDPSYIQQLFDVAVLDKGDIWAVGTSQDDEDRLGRGMIAHFVGCPTDK